jgi:hypothetical protein
MNWQSFPFKDHPRKTIFLMVFLVLFAVGIYFSFGRYWMIISMIFFCVSISAYFLPTKYIMDDNGVTIKGIVAVRAKKWSEFGSCYKDKNGILLSPFDKPTRLDSYRGTYIRFNKNSEEVTKFVKSKIEKKE